MIRFQITKKSKKSRARLGLLETSHGVVETPAFVPVATQAVIKTLTSEDVVKTKTQIVISNTFHLHLKPGEKVLRRAGGIHSFMNWQKPVMTDSGGFQVFSLGFGRDLGIGKVLKFFPSSRTSVVAKGNTKNNRSSLLDMPNEEHMVVSQHSKPKDVRITPDGVYFRSPVDGDELFIGPKESMAIQADIGADIIFAFDECTPPLANEEYASRALKRTHDWAKKCVVAKKSNQALFGIVQGSHYKNLRKEAAAFTAALDVDGFGIGGDLGKSKKDMKDILGWVMPELQEEKPRHLLGIGHLDDMEEIVKSGIDTFDCTAPTHYARRGVAFTSQGKITLSRTAFLKDRKPLDVKCECMVCGTYTRDYLSHLVRAKEITGLSLLSFHNVYFFNTFIENIREKIKKGKI